MAVVLDTSFLVDLRAGRPAALRMRATLAERGEAALVPTPVLAEFLTGSSDPARDLAEVRNSAQLVEFGTDDAANAAAIARRSRKHGAHPNWGDVLIAGFAATRALPVVTRNPSDFPETRTIGY